MHTSSFAWAGNCEGASSIAPKTKLHRPFGFWMLFDDTTRALCSNMPIDWFSHPLRQYGTEFHLSTDCEMWLHFHTPMPVFSGEYVCVCVWGTAFPACAKWLFISSHISTCWRTGWDVRIITRSSACGPLMSHSTHTHADVASQLKLSKMRPFPLSRSKLSTDGMTGRWSRWMAGTIYIP